MMHRRTVIIVGCGYVGSRLAELLLESGDRVIGVRRHWPTAPSQSTGPEPKLEERSLDVEVAGCLAALPVPTHIVYAVAAGAFADEAYRRAYVTGLRHVVAFAAANRAQVARLVFVSSTGVYGPGHGDWTDEETPAAVDGPFSSRRLLEGESLLAASGLPYTIARLGGIYGPGRQTLFDDVVNDRLRLVGDESPWTNRIHREDAAQMLAFLLNVPAVAPLYLGVDDEPTRRDEIACWLATALGKKAPACAEKGDATSASPQRGNRRCSNARLKSAGFQFTYPTYRHGFRALIDAKIKSEGR